MPREMAGRISPCWPQTQRDSLFGWNILDKNFTTGGLLGYSSLNVMVSLKVPPSHGESSGPNMTAFQSMRLLGSGAAFTPCGGSFWSFLRSRKSL